jgi:hypothetical protein
MRVLFTIILQSHPPFHSTSDHYYTSKSPNCDIILFHINALLIICDISVVGSPFFNKIGSSDSTIFPGLFLRNS